MQQPGQRRFTERENINHGPVYLDEEEQPDPLVIVVVLHPGVLPAKAWAQAPGQAVRGAPETVGLEDMAGDFVMVMAVDGVTEVLAGSGEGEAGHQQDGGQPEVGRCC